MTQWIDAAAFDDIEDEDVMRFDHAGRNRRFTLANCGCGPSTVNQGEYKHRHEEGLGGA